MPLNRTPWRHINHSCDSNSGFKGKTTVVALRDIAKGEEVTIDYSITEATRSWKMPCHCRSPHCRKVVRSIQFLPQDFFDRNQEFIPPFLKKAFLEEKTYVLPGRKGLFAKRGAKQGERIFTVEGPVVAYPFPPDYRIGPHWLTLGKNRWIIPLGQNPWLNLRHSCHPNIGIRGARDIVALKAIAKDAELFIDDSITEADPRWHRACQCGQSHCRKVIRSIQFLPISVYNHYLPYIPTYLQKVYERSFRSKQ